ncbi:MAG: thioesterase [Verrucomicrobiaceae bacterium]|nr:MAG: thioesterase [Verrucomicrobiaceae bacterium]
MSDETLRRDTEAFLHEQIPISRAMGVAVESCDLEKLVLTAPLAVNHNHLGTAFGGSLGAIATLAGYTLLWVRMAERSSHIVIRDSRIRYNHPVKKQIRAACHEPDAKKFAAFMKCFREKGKARIRLRVTIVEDERACVEFEGEFVAIA